MKISCIFEKYLYASVYPRDYKAVWTPEMCEYFDEEEVLIAELDASFKNTNSSIGSTQYNRYWRERRPSTYTMLDNTDFRLEPF